MPWLTLARRKPVSPPGSWWQHVIFDVGIGVWFHKIALAVSRFFPSVLPYHANLMYALVHRPAPVKTSTWWRSPFTVPLLANCKSRGQDIAPGSDSPTLESLPSSDELDEPAKRAPLPFLTAPTTRVDDSVAVFNYDVDTFRQYTYEAMVPYARTRECLVALRHWFATELANPNGMRSHFPLEVRWTEQDDIWLSPTYGTRGTYIGIVQYKCVHSLDVPLSQLTRSVCAGAQTVRPACALQADLPHVRAGARSARRQAALGQGAPLFALAAAPGLPAPGRLSASQSATSRSPRHIGQCLRETTLARTRRRGC